MELDVFVESLRPEFQKAWDEGRLPLRAVRFPMFNGEAQQAIILVGEATFRASGGYEKIYPPEENN